MIVIPITIHFVNDLNITKAGQRLTPWLTEKDIRETVLPEVNRIWKPAGIEWNLLAVNVAKSDASKSERVAKNEEHRVRNVAAARLTHSGVKVGRCMLLYY